MEDHFASDQKVPHITVPKLILHSDIDETIPYKHGKGLHTQASEPKIFCKFEGALHVDLPLNHLSTALEEFIKGIHPPHSDIIEPHSSPSSTWKPLAGTHKRTFTSRLKETATAPGKTSLSTRHVFPPEKSWQLLIENDMRVQYLNKIIQIFSCGINGAKPPLHAFFWFCL